MGKAARCAFMVVLAKKAARVKRSWFARGYLMMWMRHSPGTRKPLPVCSIPARWQTFRHHGALKGSQHMPRIPLIWDAAPLDAVTLMTTGTTSSTNILLKKRAYTMPSQIAAGLANVVQAQAEVLYLIRAPEMTDVQHIYDRVAKRRRCGIDDRNHG